VNKTCSVVYHMRSNFLELLQLRSAIPYRWRVMLRENPIPPGVNSPDFHNLNLEFTLPSNSQKNLQNITCKDLYWTFIHEKQGAQYLPTAVTRWNEMFDLSADDWMSIFQLPFSCSMESKLQAFQYSILHRYVPHKSLLFRQKLVDDDRCDSCAETDTLIHRFCECTPVQTFWSDLEQWWNEIQPHLSINLTAERILFGVYGLSQNNLYALNNRILNAKLFIHKVVCCDKEIQFSIFKRFLKSKIHVEKEIYNNNGKS
jgi:hypothetical protein